MRKRIQKKGFTLIELMVTVAIIAILALIAIPSYTRYITKSNRSEALNALLLIQTHQEKYRTTHTSYATLATLGANPSTENGYYTITESNITASSYTLTATATGKQANDTGCSTIVLSYSNGSTTRTPADCWE
jgi:type IV pilus assembly protein PilE